MTQQLVAIDEEPIIAEAVKQFAIFREHMSPEKSEDSRKWLDRNLREFLRRGLIETLKVIEAADQGDVIAHEALVCVFAEMLTPPAQLKAYVERTALHGPPTRKAGAYTPYDNWLRDISFAVLVYWIHNGFGLHPTRNRESRRAQRPSACSIAATALRRSGIDISESRVQNIWSGLAGAVISFAAAQHAGFPSIIPR